MGFFVSIKYKFCDIFCKVRERRWTFVFCAAVTLIGFILGIVFFCISNYGWWYYNRCSYASKLPEAGFGVFMSYLFACVVLYLLYALCNMTRVTHYLTFFVNLVACIYCGATTAAVFVYSTVWGIMYVITLVLIWLTTMCFAYFCCMIEPPVCRSFTESICDSKELQFVLFVGFVCKIISMFVILKILTMLI